jgi:hypothetical protein
MIFSLFLVVFISNLSSNTFTKSLEKSGFVCEWDVDADELVEKDVDFTFSAQDCSFHASLLKTETFSQELSVCEGLDITNSFSLHLFRKRCVSLQTLKLFC